MMNNNMPPYGMYPPFPDNNMGGNNNYMNEKLNSLENQVNRMERQLRRMENRLTKLENMNQNPYSIQDTGYGNNNSKYMM